MAITTQAARWVREIFLLQYTTNVDKYIDLD